MATIPVPNGVIVELVFEFGGQRCENVYWVTNGSTATLANLQALWTIFKDWDFNSCRTQRSDNASLVLIALQARDAPGGATYEAAVTPPTAGTLAGGAVPPYVTLTARHTTGKAGRSYRGRSYWIGIPKVWVDASGLVPVANATAIAAAYNTLRTTLATAGWTFSVCSQYSGVNVVNGYRRAVPRASGLLTAVTNTSVERGLDSNRHRKHPYNL